MAQIFIARYTFECPVCKNMNSAAIELLAENEADARQRFRKTLLKCAECPAHISGDNALYLHVSGKT